MLSVRARLGLTAVIVALMSAMVSSAVPAVTVLLLVFGIKAAVFPLWFWLPDTYPTVPAGLGAVFGGLALIGIIVALIANAR